MSPPSTSFADQLAFSVRVGSFDVTISRNADGFSAHVRGYFLGVAGYRVLGTFQTSEQALDAARTTIIQRGYVV